MRHPPPAATARSMPDRHCTSPHTAPPPGRRRGRRARPRPRPAGAGSAAAPPGAARPRRHRRCRGGSRRGGAAARRRRGGGTGSSHRGTFGARGWSAPPPCFAAHPGPGAAAGEREARRAAAMRHPAAPSAPGAQGRDDGAALRFRRCVRCDETSSRGGGQATQAAPSNLPAHAHGRIEQRTRPVVACGASCDEDSGLPSPMAMAGRGGGAAAATIKRYLAARAMRQCPRRAQAGKYQQPIPGLQGISRGGATGPAYIEL